MLEGSAADSFTNAGAGKRCETSPRNFSEKNEFLCPLCALCVLRGERFPELLVLFHSMEQLAARARVDPAVFRRRGGLNRRPLRRLELGTLPRNR